jgi:uncharacterized delta-60 repeat protein
VFLGLTVLGVLGVGSGCGRLLGIEPGVPEGPRGTLDVTFGVGGIAVVPLVDANVDADGSGATIGHRGLAIQPDGRIVFCGNAQVGPNAEIVLGRLTPAGNVDPGFGTDGLVTMNAPGHSQDVCIAVRLLPSGSIVLGGFALGLDNPHTFLAAQFTSHGTLDPSFGGGHFVSTAIDDAGGSSVDSKAYDLAVQPDGKLVLGGYAATTPSPTSTLLRLLPDGTADDAFGSSDNGVSQDSASDGITGVALLPGGQLLTSISSTSFVAARFTPAGPVDLSYGTGRYATEPAAAALISGGSGFPFFGAQGVAIQLGGEAVVAGATNLSGSSTGGIALARFDSSGHLDTSFGQGGLVSTAIPGGNATAGDLALTLDGGFAVSALLPTTTPIGVVRYSPSGDLDVDFAGLGYAGMPGIRGTTVGEAIAVDAVGRIVVGAFVTDASTDTVSVVIARFWP